MGKGPETWNVRAGREEKQALPENKNGGRVAGCISRNCELKVFACL
jgi:hypothetical protein